MRSSFTLVAALLCACVAACSATPPPASPVGPAAASAAAAPAAAQPSAVKAPGEAKIGDTSTCPVSGEEFVVSAESPKVDYEGKTYYFCCPGCAKKFQADPAKYAGRPAG